MSKFGEGRVGETTTTGGLGALALDGAIADFISCVEGVGTGNSGLWWVVGNPGGADAGKWEAIYGVVTAGSPDSLARDGVFSSSNAGALVNWTASETKTVISTTIGEVLNFMMTNNAGTSRPAWLPQYAHWLNTTSVTALSMALFDGTDDLPFLEFNQTTNLVSLAAGVAIPSNSPLGMFPAGTKMVFVQAAVPTGWTIDNSYTDRVLRFNTTGAGTGGSWTISGLTHSHTHPMPHTHNITTITKFLNNPGSSPQNISCFAVSPLTFPTAGVNTANTSDASATAVASGSAWRPLYVDAVVGTRN